MKLFNCNPEGNIYNTIFIMLRAPAMLDGMVLQKFANTKMQKQCLPMAMLKN